MSDTSRLLSEVESAELAGVSLDTLRQYHQFGLLEAIERDQVRFFKESDIRTLFYTRVPRAQQEPAAAAPAPDDEPEISMSAVERFVTRAVHAARKDVELPAADDPLPEEQTGKPPTLEAILAENQELQNGRPVQHPAGEASDQPSPPPADAAKEAEAAAPDAPAAAEAQATETAAPAGKPESTSSAVAVDSRELNALLREQIEILREERDWLRQRIERLEARSEREQMLLLSESETIRNLVTTESDRKKRFWTFALPWFQKQ